MSSLAEDAPDSRVDIVATAAAGLSGVARLGRELARGRIPVVRELAARHAPSSSAAVTKPSPRA